MKHKDDKTRLYTIDQVKRMLMNYEYNTFATRMSASALEGMLTYALLILRGGLQKDERDRAKARLEGMVKAYNEMFKKEI